jgi:hypothetical protein
MVDDDELNKVTNEVETMTGKKLKKHTSQVHTYNNGYIKDVKLYLIITSVIFLFLLGIKPQFLYVSEKNKKVFSYSKLIKYTVIISVSIIIIHYIYTRYSHKLFPR